VALSMRVYASQIVAKSIVRTDAIFGFRTMFASADAKDSGSEKLVLGAFMPLHIGGIEILAAGAIAEAVQEAGDLFANIAGRTVMDIIAGGAAHRVQIAIDREHVARIDQLRARRRSRDEEDENQA
jgi:hypothetical protein